MFLKRMGRLWLSVCMILTLGTCLHNLVSSEGQNMPEKPIQSPGSNGRSIFLLRLKRQKPGTSELELGSIEDKQVEANTDVEESLQTTGGTSGESGDHKSSLEMNNSHENDVNRGKKIGLSNSRKIAKFVGKELTKTDRNPKGSFQNKREPFQKERSKPQKSFGSEKQNSGQGLKMKLKVTSALVAKVRLSGHQQELHLPERETSTARAGRLQQSLYPRKSKRRLNTSASKKTASLRIALLVMGIVLSCVVLVAVLRQWAKRHNEAKRNREYYQEVQKTRKKSRLRRRRRGKRSVVITRDWNMGTIHENDEEEDGDDDDYNNDGDSGEFSEQMLSTDSSETHGVVLEGQDHHHVQCNSLQSRQAGDTGRSVSLRDGSTCDVTVEMVQTGETSCRNNNCLENLHANGHGSYININPPAVTKRVDTQTECTDMNGATAGDTPGTTTEETLLACSSSAPIPSYHTSVSNLHRLRQSLPTHSLVSALRKSWRSLHTSRGSAGAEETEQHTTVCQSHGVIMVQPNAYTHTPGAQVSATSGQCLSSPPSVWNISDMDSPEAERLSLSTPSNSDGRRVERLRDDEQMQGARYSVPLPFYKCEDLRSNRRMPLSHGDSAMNDSPSQLGSSAEVSSSTTARCLQATQETSATTVTPSFSGLIQSRLRIPRLQDPPPDYASACSECRDLPLRAPLLNNAHGFPVSAQTVNSTRPPASQRNVSTTKGRRNPERRRVERNRVQAHLFPGSQQAQGHDPRSLNTTRDYCERDGLSRYHEDITTSVSSQACLISMANTFPPTSTEPTVLPAGQRPLTCVEAEPSGQTASSGVHHSAVGVDLPQREIMVRQLSDGSQIIYIPAPPLPDYDDESENPPPYHR